MATFPQRAIAIAEAALNRTTTQAERDRITKAYAAALPPDATSSQIAEAFVTDVWRGIVEHVRMYETSAETAAIVAAKATSVAADLAQTP